MHQKKLLGENLSRVLELSNKRTHLIRQMRSESSYIEFNEVDPDKYLRRIVQPH